MLGLLGLLGLEVHACNWSSFCLDSVRPAPGGGFDIYTTLCVGYGNNGTTVGAVGNTGRFLFSFASSTPGFGVSQFPLAIQSDFTSVNYMGVNVGAQPAFNAQVALFYNNNSNWYTCRTNSISCGNPGIDCKAVHFRSNFLPDSIRVYGIEGGDNLTVGCYADPDMRITFAPTTFDNCCHLSTTTSSTLAGGCGGAPGSATINVTAGLAPYGYTWSNGQTGTNTISGLTPGTYQVTVTDAAGCYDTRTITVGAGSSAPSIGLSANISASCAVNNGSLSVSGSGGSGGPYSYAWSNGMSGATISGLQGNLNYTVTITDVMGCTQSATYTVGLIGLPTAGLIFGSPERCGQNNGALTVAGNGGSGGPYTYVWNTGATTPGISGMVAGNYTVTVTDNAGCTNTATYVIANYTGPSVLSNIVDEICSSGNNGSVSTSLPSGPGPLNYVWSNGATTTGITGLTGGTYTLTLTDAVGCTTVTSYPVGAGISPLVTGSSSDEYCGLSDGSATAAPSGGVAPYNFAWSNGQTAATAVSLAAGTYTVSVTDAQGCTSTQSVVVGAQAAFTLASTYTAPGTVSTTPTGGVAPFTYQWSNGATTQTVTGLAPGVYSVVVTDALGCQVSDNVTVLIVVGVNEMQEMGFSIAPNPIGEWVTIRRDAQIASNTVSLMLYDAQGRLIQRGEMSIGQTERQWESSAWADGIYFLSIRTDDKNFLVRLVK